MIFRQIFLVDSVHQSSAQLHYQQTQDLSFLRQMGMQDLVYNDKIKLSKYSSPYYYQDQSKLFIINKQNINSETEHIKRLQKI